MLMIKALRKNLVEVKEYQNNKSQVFWLAIQKSPKNQVWTLIFQDQLCNLQGLVQNENAEWPLIRNY